MTTRQRFTTVAGIALGTAGLLAACWHIAAVPERGGVLAGFSWMSIGVAPLFGVAVWLVRQRPEHPQARRLLLLTSSMAVFDGISVPVRDIYAASGAGGWLWPASTLSQCLAQLSVIIGVQMLSAFPDGGVERRWQRILLRLMWLHLLLPPLLLLASPNLVIDPYLLDPAPQVPSPFAVPQLAWLAGPAGAAAKGFAGPIVVAVILSSRYLHASRQLQARMRSMVYAMALIIPVSLAYGALTVQFGQNNPLWRQGGLALGIVVLLTLSAITVIGIVRHRLFDVDVTLRRSVVFGVLSLGIAGIYFGLAAAPGLALGNRIPVELAVVMTIGAAVIFQPLRRRLEKLADRIVFGERINRYQVLTAFGSRLEHTVELGDLLPRLADTTHQGLAASWVRVTLPDATAVAGQPSGETMLTVPLERGREMVGTIECGAKDGGYQPDDRVLLSTLAGQAATAIANVQLTARLAEQVAELERSRARIVTAQDTERRRIERNIHDGAQQNAVSLIMKLRLARNQLGRGDRSRDDVFDELQRDTRDLLTDLRELAHGIHPPVLSDQGLVPAVQAKADRVPLDIHVHADTALLAERFDAEIEGAAYYVVCEALTNFVKHGAAHTAGIELTTRDGHLAVLVRDDGTGITSASRNGHGLANLRDRVETLGGTLTIDSSPGTGTTVHATMPIGGNK
ncbi:ATP-binding protein [Amycolatopsis sp. NPDC004378]